MCWFFMGELWELRSLCRNALAAVHNHTHTASAIFLSADFRDSPDCKFHGGAKQWKDELLQLQDQFATDFTELTDGDVYTSGFNADTPLYANVLMMLFMAVVYCFLRSLYAVSPSPAFRACVEKHELLCFPSLAHNIRWLSIVWGFFTALLFLISVWMLYEAALVADALRDAAALGHLQPQIPRWDECLAKRHGQLATQPWGATFSFPVLDDLVSSTTTKFIDFPRIWAFVSMVLLAGLLGWVVQYKLECQRQRSQLSNAAQRPWKVHWITDVRVLPRQKGDKGGQGEVRCGETAGHCVAVKLSTESNDKAILNEIQQLARYRHRNIVYFIGWGLPKQLLGPGETRNMALILEWCPGGCLQPEANLAPKVADVADLATERDMLVRLGSTGSSLAVEKVRVDMLVRLGVARAVACGMDYLHTKMGKPHNDLKPANILLKRWPPAIPGVADGVNEAHAGGGKCPASSHGDHRADGTRHPCGSRCSHFGCDEITSKCPLCLGLVCTSDDVKICDFAGGAEFMTLTHVATERLLTDTTGAPLNDEQRKLSDVMSFGVVCFELSSQQKHTTNMQAYSAGLRPWPSRGNWPSGADAERAAVETWETDSAALGAAPRAGLLVFPAGVPADWVNLLQSCWLPEAAKRPSFADIGCRIDKIMWEVHADPNGDKRRDRFAAALGQQTSIDSMIDARTEDLRQDEQFKSWTGGSPKRERQKVKLLSATLKARVRLATPPIPDQVGLLVRRGELSMPLGEESPQERILKRWLDCWAAAEGWPAQLQPECEVT
jgi:serine/threonine protein kinase